MAAGQGWGFLDAILAPLRFCLVGEGMIKMPAFVDPSTRYPSTLASLNMH